MTSDESNEEFRQWLFARFGRDGWHALPQPHLDDLKACWQAARAAGERVKHRPSPTYLLWTSRNGLRLWEGPFANRWRARGRAAMIIDATDPLILSHRPKQPGR